MNMQEIMSGGFGIFVVLFFFVMAVLIFFMPFFIYGTNKRTKETSLKLDETNNILSDRDALLGFRYATITRNSYYGRSCFSSGLRNRKRNIPCSR